MHAPRPVELAAGRVRLEPLTPAHASDLLEAAYGDDEAFRWMPLRAPRTAQDAAELVGWHGQHNPTGLAWAVVVDGRAQGSTSYLDVDLAVEGLEIGWTWYARPLWGSEVNPTCKLLLLGHAFEQLGAARVTLKADAANARSRAAISKLGAAYDGTLRHHKRRNDGSVRDTAYYSVLAAEWPAVRAGLQARLVQLAADR